MNAMLVKLTYFKPSGKFYSEGSYRTSETELYKIWDEVKRFKREGRQPGLADGCTEFIVSIDVPRHQHRHPHLIMEETL